MTPRFKETVMAKVPLDDKKKRPGKAPPTAFDPKAEDWHNRGKQQFKDRKPSNANRPFKGGGRGR
jgi:hypothetical protein